MVRLSVFKAAKLVGVSRAELQDKINNNQLRTHEGYLTMADLRKTYPDTNFESEQDKLISRANIIKRHAIYKSAGKKKISRHNQDLINKVLNDLKQQNQLLCQMIDELSHRLCVLEQKCHHQDKRSLHQLQHWLEKQITWH